MQRSKMRKLRAMADKVGMAQPQNRPYLAEALGGCRNDRTRERLRSRILRGTPQ